MNCIQNIDRLSMKEEYTFYKCKYKTNQIFYKQERIYGLYEGRYFT